MKVKQMSWAVLFALLGWSAGSSEVFSNSAGVRKVDIAQVDSTRSRLENSTQVNRCFLPIATTIHNSQGNIIEQLPIDAAVEYMSREELELEDGLVKIIKYRKSEDQSWRVVADYQDEMYLNVEMLVTDEGARYDGDSGLRITGVRCIAPQETENAPADENEESEDESAPSP